MSLAELLALLMLFALILYALLGGADFGGGVWDLFARGPRAEEQRKLIERALAPVWEANHVWLILVIVILFSAFPAAFAAVSIALHVPLTLLLLGVVLRGSAFVFRQYGGGGERVERRWGRVFAIASVATPVCLGIVLGSVSAGTLRFEPGGAPVGGFFRPWLSLFPLSVGLFALALFAFLAAVYLTVEANTPELREDFRRCALAAAVFVAVTALGTALSIGADAAAFRSRLFGSWWSIPLQLATAVCAIGAILMLLRRHYQLARVFSASQVALILLGWGLAQEPHLVAPQITIQSAAAPAATLKLLLPALVIGSVLLFPSLYWLLRIFKSKP